MGVSHLMAVAMTAVSLAFSAAAPTFAQSGADFFDGKTVNYIVATDPGGGYDTYGRLVAEFMQKQLPGSTFVVRNMPGAGHLIGANFISASDPDGLTLGTFNTGLMYRQLVGDADVRLDLTKLSWIGKAAIEPRVLLMSTESGITTFEGIKNSPRKLKFSASGVGSGAYIETMMLLHVLDLPIEVITGYSGQDDLLAMRRGEIDGTFSSRSTFERFVAEGHGTFIAQIGGFETDVPQLSTLVEEADAKQVVTLIDSQATIARLTAAPPNIPEDRLQALRDAYAGAVADPEFLKRAEALGVPVQPLVGDDVTAAIDAALLQTTETIQVIREAFEK